MKIKRRRAEVDPMRVCIERSIERAGLVRWAWTGSWRRGCKRVSDLNLLVEPMKLGVLRKHAIDVFEEEELIFVESRFWDRITWRFDIDGVYVDVRVCSKDAWGAGLVCFTGPPGLVAWMRSYALSQHMRLRKTGLFHDGMIIACREEEHIFDALGLPYLAAEERNTWASDPRYKHLREASRDDILRARGKRKRKTVG